MTTTDANGIVYLQDTDDISPFHTLINVLQSATSNALNAKIRIARVANITERNALAVSLGASPTNPLYTHRTDAPAGAQLEYTTNGTTWTTLGARVGAKVQMSNGAVASSTITALGPDAALRNGSPGFVRTSVGIQVPTTGLYTIHAQTNLGGAGLPSRAFLDMTFSAYPYGITTTADYRMNMNGESAVSGTAVVPLNSGTVVGLNAYQVSGASRTFDGFMTVIGEPLPAGW